MTTLRLVAPWLAGWLAGWLAARSGQSTYVRLVLQLSACVRLRDNATRKMFVRRSYGCCCFLLSLLFEGKVRQQSDYVEYLQDCMKQVFGISLDTFYYNFSNCFLVLSESNYF